MKHMDERFRDRMRRERVDLILREAAGLASTQGWSSLRLEDVAMRAGIAKGTIYLDFKDKDELIAAASRRSMGELLTLMKEAADATADDDRLRAALRVLTGLPVEQTELSALVRCTHTDDVFTERALEDVERFLTRLIRDAQSDGVVDQDVDAEFAAQSTLAAVAAPAWSRIATKQGPDALLAQLFYARPPTGT